MINSFKKKNYSENSFGNNKMGTQSPLHKRKFLGVGALKLRHSPYSKIGCIEGLSIQWGALIGCIEQVTKKVV